MTLDLLAPPDLADGALSGQDGWIIDGPRDYLMSTFTGDSTRQFIPSASTADTYANAKDLAFAAATGFTITERFILRSASTSNDRLLIQLLDGALNQLITVTLKTHGVQDSIRTEIFNAIDDTPNVDVPITHGTANWHDLKLTASASLAVLSLDGTPVNTLTLTAPIDPTTLGRINLQVVQTTATLIFRQQQLKLSNSVL